MRDELKTFGHPNTHGISAARWLSSEITREPIYPKYLRSASSTSNIPRRSAEFSRRIYLTSVHEGLFRRIVRELWSWRPERGALHHPSSARVARGTLTPPHIMADTAPAESTAPPAKEVLYCAGGLLSCYLPS